MQSASVSRLPARCPENRGPFHVKQRRAPRRREHARHRPASRRRRQLRGPGTGTASGALASALIVQCLPPPPAGSTSCCLLLGETVRPQRGSGEALPWIAHHRQVRRPVGIAPRAVRGLGAGRFLRLTRPGAPRHSRSLALDPRRRAEPVHPRRGRRGLRARPARHGHEDRGVHRRPGAHHRGRHARLDRRGFGGGFSAGTQPPASVSVAASMAASGWWCRSPGRMSAPAYSSCSASSPPRHGHTSLRVSLELALPCDRRCTRASGPGPLPRG
jgi:hypothetical protein